MRIKKLNSTIFIILISLGNQSFSQNTKKDNGHSDLIKHTTFDNVYIIKESNIVSDGKNYLFDVNIPKTTKTPIIFVQGKIPLSLLSSIYPEFLKIIVIVPNWTYYNRTSNQELRGEPVASSIVYEFNRTNGTLLKDSIIINGGFPKMKYVKHKELNSKEKAVYYTESYGSSCCPRDPQWDNKPTSKEFITLFERKKNVKIKKTYSRIEGKEGECTLFYCLKGLSNLEKLEFILERNYGHFINRHLKDIVLSPIIVTPSIIQLNNRIIQIE